MKFPQLKLPKISWNKKWTIPALFAGGVVLGVGITIATAFYLKSELFSVPATQPSIQNPELTPPNPEGTPEPLVELDVDWNNQRILRVTELVNLFTDSPEKQRELEKILKDMNFKDASANDDPGTYYVAWRAGTVQSGDWKNAEVYTVRISDGPGFNLHSFLRPTASSTVYGIGMSKPEDSSSQIFNPFVNYISFLPNTTITGSDYMPDTLRTTDGVTLYKASRYWIMPFRFELTEPLREITRTTDGQTVYQRQSDRETFIGQDVNGNRMIADNGCFSVFAPNGMEHVYTTHIPLKQLPGTTESYQRVPDITWSAGYEHEGDYIYMRTGGCGNVGCLNVISQADLNKAGTLAVIGKTREGDNLYAAADEKNDPRVQLAYDNWYDPTWGSDYTYGEGGVTSPQKPPIDEFLKKYPVPIFYWKDPFGRWVIHMTSVAVPPVECGKPVIYLYPEQTTDVRVSLPSFINVTVSDPSYPAEGWHVTAQPDGTLTDKRDGKTYGSLYWEGTGVGYHTPTDGWVVKEGEVESFLAETLPRYGLNAQEAKDFMEFWVPKMTGAPYYRVSFLTSEWSKAAPLGVSPRPQSVIRIFMDWRPLSAPITITAPNVVTPKREGFTLVEWGGTLWK